MAAKEFGSTATDNTVVGQSILISGKLTGDEDLTVRGRVEGELSLTKTLIVEPSGIVKANVSVKNAIVSGVVVGNISASESVELTQEGRMVGDIRAPRVIIVDGASFRGRIDMGDARARPEGEDRPAARPSLVRPTVRATVPARPAPKPPPPPAAFPAKGTAAPAAPAAGSARPAPPPPPAPPVLVDAGKKRVVVKKPAGKK